MAVIRRTADQLEVRFTTAEKILGLVRDHSFPVSSITSMKVVDHALHAVHGLRAPGLGLPGFRMIGTWRGSGKTLASVRRGQPAVVVELAGEQFARLVIGTDDAAEVLREHRA